MRGAMMLTAAKTPYRRAGFAFPVGVPLTVAILALTVIQLRQLLTDPAITLLVGRDEGGFVLFPELTADVGDDVLQAFIDAAPQVDLADIAPVPPGPDAELGDLRQQLGDTIVALGQVNDQVAGLQADIVTRDARIAELEADLAKAKAKPAAKLKSAE